MTRTLALTCSECHVKFGGGETFDRHRYIAGDRYRCRTEVELASRGFYADRWRVWHRGANPAQTSLLGPTETDRGAYPASLYNGSPPSERVSTSEAAAVSIYPSANTIRGKVLAVISDLGSEGATDDEVEGILGMRHQTVSARRRELYLLGLIVEVGTRRTRSGRLAKVWVAR